MNPAELFKMAVTGKGVYTVSYLEDGWTREITIPASTPYGAMMETQKRLGSICPVVFVERER